MRTRGKRSLRRRDARLLVKRRLQAIDEAAGSLPDVYEPGYPERLRDEWRDGSHARRG